MYAKKLLFKMQFLWILFEQRIKIIEIYLNHEKMAQRFILILSTQRNIAEEGIE